MPMAAHTKLVNQPLTIQMQRLTDRYVWFDLSINRLMLASAQIERVILEKPDEAIYPSNLAERFKSKKQ